MAERATINLKNAPKASAVSKLNAYPFNVNCSIIKYPVTNNPVIEITGSAFLLFWKIKSNRTTTTKSIETAISGFRNWRLVFKDSKFNLHQY